MSRLWLRLRALEDERGSIIVVAGIAVVVFALLGAVIIEIGQTMSHRRHLQVQADAAALAAAQEFPLCSTDPSSAYAAMKTTADKYGGFAGAASYNQQVGSASGYAGSVFSTYQSPNYPTPPAGSGYTQHAPETDSVFTNSDGSPRTDTTVLTCGDGTASSEKMFDVKASEYGIHGVFSFGPFSTVNAHARVELKPINEATGLLPLAVPDVRPKFIFATFIDESTGSPLAGCANGCVEELKEQSDVNNEATWAPDPGTELSVPVNVKDIGVRIRLVGGDDPTLQCGQLYTQCYDATSANGLIHIRGWQDGAGPRAKDVWLTSGAGATACVPDAYFTQTACSAGITADIDLNTTVTATTPAVWAEVDGGNTKYPLVPRTTGTGTLRFDGSGIPISGDGPHTIELKFGSGQGTSLGVVQRAYVANPSGSGPLDWVQVYQPGVGTGANSFKFGSTPALGVTIKTVGKLLLSQPADPPIYLRVFNDSGSASQNQSLNCEPQGSPNNTLRDQLANGCSPLFKTQTSLTCPANSWNGIQALPQPWTCVGISTGATVGQISQGLDLRIFGDQNPPSTVAECQLHPIHWIKPQYADPANGIRAGFDETLPGNANDKRVLPLFVTPLGTFQSTGQDVVPLIDFGYFYVTGYKGDPCEGNDQNQDPVPNNRGAYVRGHFVKFFPLDNKHVSDDNCDLTTITPCVGVLTR